MNSSLKSIYIKRLVEEIKLIKKKRFSRYFNIAHELVNWCKTNDILVGPGRGSSGGSIIAFLLNITTVDPIKHDLLFSRFINKDRLDLPDIDIDFEDRKRHIVKQHLEASYGEDHIANVSSFNRMKAKGVVKDVSRVFDLPLREVEDFTKLIEDNDDHTGIQEAIDSYEEGKKFAERYPTTVKISQILEGQIRNYGSHAAALIVSREPLTQSDRCNLIKRKVKNEATILINWEKNNAEFVGLMKLDALGLKLLSIFSETKKLIKENYDKDIDIDKIDIEDKEVLKEINRGNTIGLFQLNTYAMTTLIKEMGVKHFKDLSDALALVRPGPSASGMTEEYVKRKHGKQWKEQHIRYARITNDTYGVVVYQEQVMEVINKMAGLPYSTADKIRKIIGKKRSVKEFAPYKRKFIKGCLEEKTFNKTEAKEFWATLQEHARYCVTGDTTIYKGSTNENTGREIKVKELFRKQKYWNFRNYGYHILSMFDDGFIRPNKIKEIYDTGMQPVYFIQTISGKYIRATKNHKFLVNGIWKKVCDLKIGEMLKVCDLLRPSYKGNGWGKGAFAAKPNSTNPRDRKGKGYGNRRRRKRIELINFYKGCQKCGSTNNLDLHHIDGNPNHNRNRNLKLLCRKCHKKEHHSKSKPFGISFSRGFYSSEEEIIAIKTVGIRQTYDIEMEKSPRNFLANGIVVHNSFGKAHTVAYAILGMQSGWLKKYYPTEFICASLTYGSKTKKPLLIEEAYRLGLTLVLPKVGISEAEKWVAQGDKLYIPFSEVKTIGPTKAQQAATSSTNKNIQKLFYAKSNAQARHKGTLGELLNDIGAYNQVDDVQISEKIQSYFDFRVMTDPRNSYKNLYDFFQGKVRLDRVNKILTGDLKEINTLIKSKDIIEKIQFGKHRNLLSCNACKLREECNAPVCPSPGKYNIVILGEAPGYEEDKKGKGFINVSGKLIWKVIERKKYKRKDFHITNVCKCFPSITKRPTHQQILTCSKFIQKELKEIKPKIILAFGNTSLDFFTGQKSGITSMSGKIVWNEKYCSWIVYCVHPAATLHNPDNKPHFKAGMKSFFNLLKIGFHKNN